MTRPFRVGERVRYRADGFADCMRPREYHANYGGSRVYVVLSGTPHPAGPEHATYTIRHESGPPVLSVSQTHAAWGWRLEPAAASEEGYL